MVPLTFVAVGETVLIKKISGKDETKHFLESLGFIVGSEVTIISKFGQNFIINVKETLKVYPEIVLVKEDNVEEKTNKILFG